MSRRLFLGIVVIAAALCALAAVGIAVASTGIVGGSWFDSAVQIAPGVEYSAALSDTHTGDYFYVDVNAGQMVTVVFTATSLATWEGADFALYDQGFASALDSHYNLGRGQHGTFAYMGNTTTPKGYYFVAENTSATLSNPYLFKLTISNQSDANQLGDAADLVDDARVVNAPLGQASTFTGTLGYADVEDWYKFSVAPGSIVTVTVSHLNPVGGRIDVAFQDQGQNGLGTDYLQNSHPGPAVFVYMSNNTAPSAYYVHLSAGGGNPILRYQIRIEIGRQADLGVTGDAGDTFATGQAITPTMGITTTYPQGLLGYQDQDDYYRIKAVSGEIITVTFTHLDPTVARIDVQLMDQASIVLGQDYIQDNHSDPVTLQWMANNSTPSTYYLHVSTGGGTHDYVRYEIQVALGQQSDAGVAGDAGDGFGPARLIALTPPKPTLVASRNLLGGSDTDDYYLVKLPDPGFGQPPIPYRFYLVPVEWPEGAGYLGIEFYDAQRNALSDLGGSITAPSVKPFTANITDCGADGCYVHITSGYSGYYQLQYELRVVPPRCVFLGLVLR